MKNNDEITKWLKWYMVVSTLLIITFVASSVYRGLTC